MKFSNDQVFWRICDFISWSEFIIRWNYMFKRCFYLVILIIKWNHIFKWLLIKKKNIISIISYPSMIIICYHIQINLFIWKYWFITCRTQIWRNFVACDWIGILRKQTSTKYYFSPLMFSDLVVFISNVHQKSR